MASDFSKKHLPQSAADFLSVKKSTLESWRFYGKGPVYFRSGGKIFYLESDLIAFLEAGRVRPIAGPAAEPIAAR
jgi:hypothetical protein